MLLVLAVGVAQAAPQPRIAPLGYQITQLQAVPGNRQAFDITARASIANSGSIARGVTARLASKSPYFITLDGDLSFGDVPATSPLRPAMSRDTFKVRVILPPHRQLPEFWLDLHRSLAWSVSCANCGAANRPPIANAGSDQTSYVSQPVVLDGGASADPDGQPLTYSWSFLTRPAGSTASLTDASGVKPIFTPDREGDYVIQLVVRDGELASAPDTVQISTLNSPPVASAGADRNAFVGEIVALDGSASSDVDGDALTYSWSIAARPAGSSAEIEDDTEVRARITPDVPGQYLIELVVDDGTVSSVPDTISISTARINTPPVANAGPDQSTRVGDVAQLDGSASSDADGDPLTFTWSLNTKPLDSAADLEGKATSNPTLRIDRPGTYVAQLIVTDGASPSAADTVSISTLNSRPTAVPGSEQAVHWNTTVHLDGSASSDPDGDPLGFAWAILSRPQASAATLSDPNAIQPSFVPDRPGLYVVQLVVDDGSLASNPASVSILANNQPPIALADSATLALNGSVDIAVLVNDNDPDGDALSIQAVTSAAHGLATVSGASIRYVPASGYSGSDTFNYTVTDGAESATATVTVTVLASTNRAPVANAGPDQTVPEASNVQLNGSQSSDPDGDVLSYSWVLQSTPETSTATLSDANTATPQFTADRGGIYTALLTVSDGHGGTATDTVSINVTPTVSLPELRIDDLSVTEGNAGTTTAVFTITQSAPSQNVTTVSYETANDSATAPGDYVATSGTVQIAPGSTTAQVSVTINGDTSAEADESLFVRLSTAVNATIRDGEGVVEIVNDDEGAAATSLQLIRRALADGVIDAETALLYEVFAERGDARLPTQYHGLDEPFFEGIAIREAARRFDTLTPATQAILAPFLEFPDLFAVPVSNSRQLRAGKSTLASAATSETSPRASALAAETSYAVLELVPGVVRVGWDANSPLAFVLEQNAHALKAEFDARIWPKLQTFLGAQVAGKILILLSDSPGGSFESVSTDCTVAHITLTRFEPHVLAHELTHALLDLNYSIAACNEPEKLWMHEATAHWAQHYVYPPADQGKEQAAATWLLKEPERSLSAYDKSPRGHEYGAYLWFFRLAGQGNNPGVVRAIWESAAGVTSLEAIESVLRGSGLGGFREQWPKFALDNWNREAPYHKYYEWDSLSHKAAQHEFTPHLDGAAQSIVALGYDLPILSADYQRWDFKSDPNIRSIRFMNSEPGVPANAGIHAIVKIKGQPWKTAEDWSDRSSRAFCRDKAEEDVEEIIFVITNRGYRTSDPRIQDGGRLVLHYSALPCNDFTGSTTYRFEQTSTVPAASSVVTAVGSNLRFRVHPDNAAVWRTIEGSVSVQLDEVGPFEDGTCRTTASYTFDAKDHAQFEILPHEPGNTLGTTGGYIAFLPTPPTLLQTSVCTSSSGSFTFAQDVPYFGTMWFYMGPPRPFDVNQTTISGSYSQGNDTWNWTFHKEQ